MSGALLDLADADRPIRATGAVPCDAAAAIVRRVRMRVRRRAAWLAHLAAGGEGDTRLPTALRPWLDVRDEPEAEATWWATQALPEHPDTDERAGTDLAGPAGGPLRRLARSLRLDTAELDLAQVAFALETDPMLALACGSLLGVAGPASATEALAARLFPESRRSGNGDRNARLWRLFEPDVSMPGGGLRLDPTIVRLLRGHALSDERLDPILCPAPSRAPLPSWPVDELAEDIRDALRTGTAIRVTVTGDPGSGRATFAACVCRRLGLESLPLDTGAIADADWDELQLRAQRLAHLGGAVPVWRRVPAGRRWPVGVPPFPLQFLTAMASDGLEPHPFLAEHRVVLPEPTLAQRRALWREHVPAASDWSDAEIAEIASRHPVPIGDLVAVGERAPGTPGRASALCRERTRDRLGELARPIASAFDWDDLVVHATLRESLEQFAFEVTDHAAFFEGEVPRRLFPRGGGLVGLLSGPPGTGKTMAAEVIANVVGLDLVRVDLASVCSRYIGDAARALREIFRASIHGVLLLDEADAIFARRTDIRDSLDRHANTDTGYLLQLLEESDRWAAVLLATNKRANIDPAFIRRIRYVFEFGRPDASLRARVWERLLGVLVPLEGREALLAHCEALGRRFDATPAQIKNAILAAVFLARREGAPLDLSHLSRGMAREWGKSGHSESPTELPRAVPRA